MVEVVELNVVLVVVLVVVRVELPHVLVEVFVEVGCGPDADGEVPVDPWALTFPVIRIAPSPLRRITDWTGKPRIPSALSGA